MKPKIRKNLSLLLVCILMFTLAIPLMGAAVVAEGQDVPGDSELSCICRKMCKTDVPNTECPVCAADVTACAGCTCDHLCAEDAPNIGCRVCAGDVTACAGCICDTKCAWDAVNPECHTCAADVEDCTGVELEPDPICVCETRCTADMVNPACQVCVADIAVCVGVEPPPPVCVCETRCTADVVNPDCPVCTADIAACAGAEPPLPVCICETKCAADAVSPTCVVCTSDITACVGVEPPPAPVCICNTKCAVGMVNGACPVCALDMTACGGAEPVICICQTKCEAGAVNLNCQICSLNMGGCSGKAPAPVPDSNVSIRIYPPSGWATGSAVVEIDMTDNVGAGFFKAEVKVGKNGKWLDITDDLNQRGSHCYGFMEISENCTVYVCVTGWDGQVFEKSRYIECFDRTAPTLRASISGRLLRAEASDDLSGVAAIYIDGTKYTALTNGTVDVPVQDLDTTYEQLSIQAVDYAGNRSKIVQVKNPSYQKPGDTPTEPPKQDEGSQGDSTTGGDDTQAGSFPFDIGSLLDAFGEMDWTFTGTDDGCDCSTTQPPATTVPVGTTTTTTPTPPSTGSTSKPTTGTTAKPTTSGAPASATVDPAETPDTTPKNPQPLTPDGQGEVVDNVSSRDDKEFFTITTPNENIFYLIIDRQRENDNVYFLNAVTESDLMALAEKDTEKEPEPEAPDVSAVPDPAPACTCKDKCVPGEVDLDCPVCILTLKNCAGKEVVTDVPDVPKPEKKSSLGAILIILILAAGIGGAGYYFKIYKPKQDLDDAEDFEDVVADDEEPEVYEDETPSEQMRRTAYEEERDEVPPDFYGEEDEPDEPVDD